MIDFPAATLFNKPLGKKTFYDKCPVSAAQKEVFVHDIDKMVWRNKLSGSTLPVQPGQRVTEVEVIEIVLKRDSLCLPVLQLLDGHIPYHLLFLLRLGDLWRACIGYRETSDSPALAYFHTGWMTFAELPLKVRGLTLDEVYDQFLCQIHPDLAPHENISLAEAIRAEARKRQIETQLAKLEKKAWAEKQPRRKLALLEEIKLIKRSTGDPHGKTEHAHAGRRRPEY